MRWSARAPEVEVDLPRPLVEALVAAADSLDEGGTVAVVSEEAEVSPAQAAKLLGVSRQYVDRLVAAEVLPCRRLPRSSYRKIQSARRSTTSPRRTASAPACARSSTRRPPQGSRTDRPWRSGGSFPTRNVCYPISLLDLILRLDEASLYEVLWTEDLLDELAGKWVERGIRSREAAERICAHIR